MGPEGNQIVKPVSFTVTAVIFGVFAVVCYLIVFLIIQFAYPLGKKEVEQNTEALRRQRLAKG